jgi:hypothetical protein
VIALLVGIALGRTLNGVPIVGSVANHSATLSENGDLPQTANVHDLAGYVCTILYGLRVLAANGDGKAELKRVTDMALKMLPL